MGSNSWRDSPITDKQLAYIRQMQLDADMNGAIPLPPFRGDTKGAACDYINENKGKQFAAFDYYGHGDNYGDRV